MLDIGEALYVITTPVLRLVEPFRNRRRSLMPNTHQELNSEYDYCQRCKRDTLHHIYRWRLEDVVTWECSPCGNVVEKS